jgi:D-alanyl-D-alanine carboxypeptidase
VVVLFVLAAGAAAAIPANADQRAPALSSFQAAIQHLVKDGVPGAIGFARDGSTVTVAASGLADVATKTPMVVRDRVRIGSLTKTFVATVVLQLDAEHRLSLSDTVSRWLPGLVPGGADITIQELLQHFSGIYSYTDDPGFQQALTADPTRVWRPRELVRIAVAHPPVFPPGTTFSYSNTDYVLLGMIIRAATGHTVGQELRDRIFEPLGLRDTSFPYADPHLPRPFAHGYLISAAGPVDTTVMSPSWLGAAGGMVSTAPDVARFYTALFGGKLLPAAQLRELMTTAPIAPGIGYGLGVMSVPLSCGTAWGHQGDVFGYFSNGFTTTDDRGQAIVLVNADLSSLSSQAQNDIQNAVVTGACGTS